MTIHFDDATRLAREIALDLDRQGHTVLLVRDIAGRFSIIVDDRSATIVNEQFTGWEHRFVRDLGDFAAKTPVFRATDLFDAEELFASPDLRPLDLTTQSPRSSGFIERQVVGSDWPRVRDAPLHRRVTLYGYKGGVGRSTATIMLAKHLADLGRNVLVADLDLESPGVGPLLVSDENSPQFGLVDHVVESAITSTQDLDLVARSDRIPTRGNGEIWVAPARGRARRGYAYLPKLNRLYLDIQHREEARIVRFPERLDAAITACEERVAARSRRVDVVLLDSRAGVHDIAAASITQLSDLSLLFATDNQQTWTGYSELFEQWRDSGVAHLIRDRLRMVASMTPPLNSEIYLDRFRDRAQACFASYLYDDAEGGDEDAFNPFIDDENAPHYPLPITFSTDLLGLDLVESPDWHTSHLITAAYTEFVDGATTLVAGDLDD